jgi:hypothetical protein
MAEKQDLFYRPDINAPEREHLTTPRQVITDHEDHQASQDPDKPKTALEIMKDRFVTLKDKAMTIRTRARSLLDLVIADRDPYVGQAPWYVLKCIEDLTGLRFTRDGELLPETDDVYTLSPEVVRCIFRVAGYYDPNQDEQKMVDSIKNWDSNELKNTVNKVLKNKSYFESVYYGFKLLLMVIKICYVIIVHYTIGWLCAMFKKPIMMAGTLGISYFIAVSLIGPLEVLLLSFVGYSCKKDEEEDPDCDNPIRSTAVDLKRVPCCSDRPFFFKTNENTGKIYFDMTSCFEKWITDELFSSGESVEDNTPICSIATAADESIVPTREQAAKASVVADFLREQPSITGATNSSDTLTLRSAIEASDAGVVLTSSVTSSLDSAITYYKTKESGSGLDCFGYQPVDTGSGVGTSYVVEEQDHGRIYVETGSYFYDYLTKLDDAITAALEFSDKIVTSTAMLSKWSSSRQLCCYVYLMVILATMLHSYMSKSSICSELSDGDNSFADDLRAEFSWAQSLKARKSIQQFVDMLLILKQIIDIFRNKMNRSIFLEGMTLPLKEMFTMLKIEISNGLSQFFDILLGPLDVILVNAKAVPEIRHMINNECFGFDKLMDFLSCGLGSLKYGMINEVMKLMDRFSMNDLALIDDIYLARTRMAFLDSLSRLLDNMARLILGLKDCYEPSDLVDRIVDEQINDQYTTADRLYSLVGADGLAVIDECSKSIMGQTLIPSASRIAEIDADQNRLSSSFGELGMVAENLFASEMYSQAGAAAESISGTFLTEDGTPVSAGEFMRRIEEKTGVRTSEIRESMRYIFDILKG